MAKAKEERRVSVKCVPAPQSDNRANDPIIHVVPGPQPYLWIGNGGQDGRLYASVQGRANLQRLAEGILKAIEKAKPAKGPRKGK